MESLDALSPLSPYWYNQTTYGLIDAKIQEKSGGKVPLDEETTGTDENPAEDAKAASKSVDTNLHIVPVDEPAEQECGPDVPIPSFNLGIIPSKTVGEQKPSKKGKERITGYESPAKQPRRELKLGEKMKSPYMKRQVIIGK
ncbi:hypothetical protein L6452_26060 [Arctium lappa]|uniref:Uncharacterized protein n=1 Tax=Arctium lappa TaxID=4217 RepID=A0ACB9AB81_ARCLA|nr:hypothetical protein L6452_26060 [Arctium lappa]